MVALEWRLLQNFAWVNIEKIFEQPYLSEGKRCRALTYRYGD